MATEDFPYDSAAYNTHQRKGILWVLMENC